MARGKKNCPNCNTEIGARTQLCDCGYHYPSNEVRKDLLEEKEKKQSSNPSSGKPGIKYCVNCNTEIGVRTQLCKCGWHYPSDALRLDLLEEKNKKVTKVGTGRPGMKKCVNCDIEIGGRTQLCKCGWYYPTGELRLDLLEEKKKKVAKIGTRKPGIKNCVNCNTEIGIRTHLCSNCGWHFPTGKVRKDLLEEKKTKKYKTYDTEGPGRKKCPGCSIIVGGTTKNCFKCNFDFVAAKVQKDHDIEEHKRAKKEKRDNKDEKKNSPRTEKLLQELRDCEGEVVLQHHTKKEHAERILDKGKEKAKLLYKYAKKHSCWSHVDWNYVRDELGIQKEENVEEVEVEV